MGVVDCTQKFDAARRRTRCRGERIWWSRARDAMAYDQLVWYRYGRSTDTTTAIPRDYGASLEASKHAVDSNVHFTIRSVVPDVPDNTIIYQTPTPFCLHPSAPSRKPSAANPSDQVPVLSRITNRRSSATVDYKMSPGGSWVRTSAVDFRTCEFAFSRLADTT